MPKFLSEKDINFFQHINSELIQDIVETSIYIYKLLLMSDDDDIYGENLNKTYDSAVKIECIIEHDEKDSSADEFGVDFSQNIIARINREQLETTNFYPEEGDIIEWHNKYFEIDNIPENQTLGGRQNLNWELKVYAHLVTQTQINLDKRTK